MSNFLLFIAFALYHFGKIECSKQSGLAEIYDKLLTDLENKTKYDNRIRPFIDEKPLEVTISLYISSLNSISEDTMLVLLTMSRMDLAHVELNAGLKNVLDYKLELYFREYWHDPRLSYGPEMFNNRMHISLHESLAKHIWLPDTFIPNAVRSLNPRDSSISHRSLLRLKPDGEILMSRRISVTAECQMDLTFYPFDQQVCLLSIESYGHSIQDLVYKWRQLKPVTLSEDLELPQFRIIKYEAIERNISLLTTGTYSRLECCFFFKRNAGFYVVQLFFPATAIVLVSWMLLWLEDEVTLGEMIDLIIAMTFLYFSYTMLMPGASYIKGTDIFLGACFLFVFLAFVKLAAYKIHARHQQRTVSRRETKTEVTLFKENMDNSVEKLNEASTSTRESGKKPCSTSQKTFIKHKFLESKRLRSCVLFPVAFVVFCLVYFLGYFTVEQSRSQRKCQF